ncbi:hypothetical protein F4859DRAFT_465072 [Xylaria cf. heliscus]|nr:hypothetical protein F4859DRAFT_465072 [Xylaria cf. heliscus]
MDKIPPEIIYVVCSLLVVDDILNFRLVNKLFADIGATYMLPEVTFYMHQEEFDRLEAISLHPIFSKHVSSLTYFAETFDSPKISWREFVRDHKSRMRWHGKLRKLNLTPSQLMGEYKKYSDAVDEQDLLMRARKDVALLKEVLPRFPKLEALTMSAGNLFYEGRYRTQRKKPFTDILRGGYISGIHPEGKRPLDALLLANAHSPCALTALRAGSLHWRFFKRSERVLARMFKPLANLTSIELSVTVDPADERIQEGNSLLKCQRLLAKGVIRKILKSMPHLECLCVEILNLECDEQEKGASLKDIIEPGFHWPKLKELVLGGIVGDRAEFMKALLPHKDTLQKLCLRDITLASTSWRKFLPDIRKNLRLEEACICGDIYGQCEDEDDMQESWNIALEPLGFEYWDLSVPEVGPHDMRESINMYCRQGGEKYPDKLPLSEDVVDDYYDEYVQPFFENDDDVDNDNNNNDNNDNDNDNDGNSDPEIDSSEEDNNENWEDVSDDDVNDDMSDGSIGSFFMRNPSVALHMMTMGFEPLDDMWDPDDPDAGSESELYDENDLAETAEVLSNAPPWLLGVIPTLPHYTATAQSGTNSGNGDGPNMASY